MKPLKNKILIVGLGNPLRADDGLGIKVVEKLNQEEWPSEVSLLKVGTSPINYFQQISQSKTVIAVDAVKGGNKPGSIYELKLDDLNQQGKQNKNAHNFSLPQVIALARETTNFPRNVIFYGMEPDSLKFDNQLSSPIKRKLPRLIKKIKTRI